MDRGLFQWDFEDGLLKKVVFVYRPEGSKEENHTDILGQALLAKNKNIVLSEARRLVWLKGNKLRICPTSASTQSSSRATWVLCMK